MTYYIAAFRSRAHTLRFYDTLRGYKLNCSVVNTPKEAGVGCGISVRLLEGALQYARLILMRGRYDTFAGFFRVEVKGGRNIVQKIS